MKERRHQVRKAPVVIRGMARIGSTDGGWLCIASNGPRKSRCRLLWENINRRNLYRATNNAYDAIGFLVGPAASGRDHSLVGADGLREDVSTRAPTNSGSGPSARTTIHVIGFALVVLFDHGPSQAASANPIVAGHVRFGVFDA
jgi:hypothetical protein